MLFEGKIVFYLKKLYIRSHVLENREFFFFVTLEFWLIGNTSTVSSPLFFFCFIFFPFILLSRLPNTLEDDNSRDGWLNRFSP